MPTTYAAQTVDLFRGLLEQGLASADRLEGVLAAERNALRTGDPDALQRLTDEKLALLQDLERWAAAHERFLRAQQLPPGRQGSEMFLAGLPHAAEEHMLWRRVRQTVSACRDSNEVNGGIVTLSRARVQRALMVLSGGSSEPSTYGKAGATRSGPNPQLIGKV